MIQGVCALLCNNNAILIESLDRVKKLIRLASTSHWNIQTIYNLPRRVSKLDKLVVIGDAAHSVYVCG